MDKRMQQQMARFAAYGAYAVCVGLVFVFGFFVWLTKPVATGGENAGMAQLTLVCAAVVVVILAAAHVALARQLLNANRR